MKSIKAIIFIIYLVVVIIGGFYFSLQENEKVAIFGNEYETDDVFGVVFVLGTLIFVFYMSFGGRKNYIGGFKKERILRDGELARAKVLEIIDSDSGMITTINNQPLVLIKLEVIKNEGNSYIVEFQDIIPRLMVPQIQPGKILWVRIDPRDSNKVVIDPLSFSVDQTLSANTLGIENWNVEDVKKLKNKGIEGEAEIIKIKDSGKSKDSEIVIDLTYKIIPDGGSAYEISSSIAFPTKIAKLLKEKEGSRVPVRIHPENKEKLIIRLGSLNIAQ